MRAIMLALILSAPVLAQPENKLKATTPSGAADIADKLQERIDLDAFDQVSLRDAINLLQDRLGYTILIDYKGILGPSGGNDANGRKNLADTPINLPAVKKLRLETVLRQVIDQVDADFIIESDYVRVSGLASKEAAIGPRRVLPLLRVTDEQAEDAQDAGTQAREARNVTAAFREVPLADALQTVSRRTGRTVTISRDAAEEAKTPVSLALANAPFETAVLTLAEAAGLRAFRAGNAAVIVTAERAKRIEEATAPGFIEAGGLGGIAAPDSVAGLRRELAKAEEDRKSLEAKVRVLMEEVEKLKKK
jgi:hypothetical protein